MTHFLSDIPSSLATISAVLENLLLPVLAIELVWLWRRGFLDRARVKEMFANASSLLFIIPAGAVGLVGWFVLFEWIASLVPWSIPVTWTSAVVCVVLADLIYYAEHRFEHTHRLLWDLYHSVHHSSPQFDQTTGLRLSGFDALLTIGFYTPMILLGFETELVLLAYGLVVAYQTWIHTELIKKMPRWFEFVFNTPSHHRAHHGANPQYLDSNYGSILILWDRLFGTFRAEVERPEYGLTTQIESSHPLDVQFSEIRTLWRDLRADRSWATRLRRLWNPPGWHPRQVSPPATKAATGVGP